MSRSRLCISILFLLAGISRGQDRVDYLTDIKPLLASRCYACHGALKQKAGLRLDTAKSMVTSGEAGPVVVPGDPAASEILRRVAAAGDARMPPESLGEPLSGTQIELLRAWIEAGAVAPSDERPEPDSREHWAFQPIVRPAVPPGDTAGWNSHPIDAFLAAQHRARGLTPQHEAPREVLVRRLYFDIVGMPPGVEDWADALHDPASDWYERIVSRLLDDPRYGERWARHWMDIWRYSDWWGLGQQLRNSQPHIWHWRDWIVESLNDDLPYDQMIRLMLAADELHPDDLDKLRATGFLARNYFLFNRPQWMEETVEHVGKGLLGLRFNCAKCHDHKYDPIEQRDFYRMRAFFEPYHVRLDVVPGEPDLARDGIPRVYDGWGDVPTYRYIRGDEKKPDTSEVITPAVPEILAFDELAIEPVSLPATAYQPARQPWVFEAYAEVARRNVKSAASRVRSAREKLSAITNEDATAIEKAAAELAVAERELEVTEAELASVELRGAAMRAEWADRQDTNAAAAVGAAIRGEQQVAVARARRDVANVELKYLSAENDKQRTQIEAELTKARDALKSTEAALGAEVAIDARYEPLIGAKWTPTRFLDSTKDDPAVAFPQQSTGRRTALADWIIDRRNPLTARVAVNHLWTRHMGEPLVASVFDFGRNGTPPTHPRLLDWLAAEFIESGWSMKHLHRLIVTSAAYRMSSSTAGGEANLVIDPDNRSWWRRVPLRLESQAVRDAILSLAGTLDLTIGGPPVPAPQQAESRRRSLYFFHSNNDRNLLLTTFDEARVSDCYRREQSVVPQQALALSNSRLVLDATVRIAERLSRSGGDEETGGQGDKETRRLGDKETTTTRQPEPPALPGDASAAVTTAVYRNARETVRRGERDLEDVAFVRGAFLVLLGIEAGDAEVAVSCDALARWRGLPDGNNATARANFVWSLINHNDFVTLR